MTFTLSPGNDARASGIRLEEMWVGEINRYTERQIYRGRWIIIIFFSRERETVGISAFADLRCDTDGL